MASVHRLKGLSEFTIVSRCRSRHLSRRGRQLAEHWHVVDVDGQMVQLGQLPAPAVLEPPFFGIATQ
jgi:hypothetical protein